jgi:hypothetical protein
LITSSTNFGKESFQELGIVKYPTLLKGFFVLVGAATYESAGCPADKGINYCTELNVSTFDFASFCKERT